VAAMWERKGKMGMDRWSPGKLEGRTRRLLDEVGVRGGRSDFRDLFFRSGPTWLEHGGWTNRILRYCKVLGGITEKE
jgi:hypothetical protein